MEQYIWKKNIELICFQAKNFPEGIQQTFDTLQQNVKDYDQRDWYGISYQDASGAIIYKAAINKLDPGEEHQFEDFTVTKGTYLCIEIQEWMKNPAQIGEAFMKMLAEPGLDIGFPCVEWYYDDNVLCLVRLKEDASLQPDQTLDK